MHRAIIAMTVVVLSGSGVLVATSTAAGAAVGCAGKAYVTNSYDGTVSVIDTATGTVSDTIPVGKGPLGVAATPDGEHVYVTNIGGGTVSVIRTATRKVSDTITVGGNPLGVAIAPDGKHAYVTTATKTEMVGNVAVIDPATRDLSDAILDATSGLPYEVAVAHDSKHVYVTNEGGRTVSVIDATKGKVSDTITVGKGPYGLAITPDGKQVYVTNRDDGTVSVIDTATGNVSAPITVGKKPIDVAICPAQVA